MKSGATKRMWLFMLRACRPVKASEIARHADIDDSTVRAMVKSMVEAGSVKRHDATAEHGVMYEVTADCAVPLGVSVREIKKKVS